MAIHSPKEIAFSDFVNKEENWKCPECGRGHEDGHALCIQESSCPDDECDKNHEQDGCSCPCGWYGTAKDIYKAALKRDKYEKCPCCNGLGVVKKSHSL